MKVLVTGATGFVGRSLVCRLLGEGFEVFAAVRSPKRARVALGGEVLLVDANSEEEMSSALGRADAIVNLAGENLFGGRWTPGRKRSLVESRVGRTRHLVSLMAKGTLRPGVLISASAVGFYGDQDTGVLDESSRPGSGFLPDLCREWEAAALDARELGVRVAVVRIGIVLGAGGGALERMLPAFHLGLGGKLGTGRQWTSWIHIDDLVDILLGAITDSRFEGVFNATSPEPVTNEELTASLGRTLGRPTPFPVPATVLKVALGEAADVLLGGQRVRPGRLEALGWRFRYARLAGAVEEIVRPGVAIRAARTEETLGVRGAEYVLESETIVAAPIAEVFDYFSRPENLGVLTPASMSFEIDGPVPSSTRAGLQIDYRLRVGPLPIRWTTLISALEAERRFVDVQLRGPYALWRHEHLFEPMGPRRTRMTDRVFYGVPGGPIGSLAQALFVAPALRRIFGFRSGVVRRRFPERGSEDRCHAA
jgi:uncharacterized protein (TIGR01777 family)